MKKLLFQVILLFSASAWSQLRDTSLYTILARPFYYNVIKGGDGKIYAGTSEGVYRFEGAHSTKLDNRIGYLTLDQKERPVIDSNGIKYHDQRTYVRLLPFNAESRDEYHAGAEDFFYIASGGKMHIYEILPFDRRYRNHSVRTASRNFVGTYSGIYYRGQKLDPSTTGFPSFTDGHIRELNGKGFICYSSLFIADMRNGDSMPTKIIKMPKVSNFDTDWASDIMYSKYYRQYFLSTKTKIVKIDSALTVTRAIFETKEKNAEVVLLGENRSLVYFACGKNLVGLNPVTNMTNVVASMPEQILDGHISKFNRYLLCSQGLYVIRVDGSFKKLIGLKKAHTLLDLGGSEFAISTDAGLFKYNTASNKLSELIQGVEFNRRGLYLERDSLFAGSIDGLYVLDARNLEQLSERIAKISKGQSIPAYIIWLLSGLFLILTVISFLLNRSRSKLNQLMEETKIFTQPKATREDIETFIRENLPQASLKSISEKFQTNNANIYTLLAPEKPGAFINRLRMEQVHKLRNEKKPAKEISKLTGFSEYYVRKVWNTKE